MSLKHCIDHPPTVFVLSLTLCQKQNISFPIHCIISFPLKCQSPSSISIKKIQFRKRRTVTYQMKWLKIRRISEEDGKIINNTKRQNYCAIIEVHKRIELEINCFFYINSGIEYSLKVMFYFLLLFLIPLEFEGSFFSFIESFIHSSLC